jgi:hypothetical protein
VRAAVIGTSMALLLLTNAGAALACDTSAWLQVIGRAHPGAVVTVHGGGLEPGSVQLVWDRSSGLVVGEAAVTPDGRLDAQITIPSHAAGAHKVIAVSGAELSSPVDSHAWTALAVPAIATSPQTSPPADVTGGSPSSRLVELAAGLAALAAAVLAVAFRRRAVRSGSARGGAEDLDVELELLVEELDDHVAARPVPVER